jgi:hypothetical protein
MNTASVNSTLSNPTLSPKAGEEGGRRAEHLVEEYPQFETEYGLPAGLDLSQPAHVVFPPPERVWQVVPAPPMAARPHSRRWTRDEIELEELHKHQEQMSRQGFNQQSFDIQNRIAKRANAEFRRRQEAAWQAEADRRNAAEEAKDQEYNAMDESQRHAYHLGILRGLEAAQEQSEEEARKKRAAKATVGSLWIVVNAEKENGGRRARCVPMRGLKSVLTRGIVRLEEKIQ